MHCLQLNGTKSACVCDGAAGHTGKYHAGENVDVAQAAGDMSYHGVRETKNALGNAAVIHNVSSQHKKWDGQHTKGVAYRHYHALNEQI